MILALHFPTAGVDYLDVSTTHKLSSHGDAESVKLFRLTALLGLWTSHAIQN